MAPGESAARRTSKPPRGVRAGREPVRRRAWPDGAGPAEGPSRSRQPSTQDEPGHDDAPIPDMSGVATPATGAPPPSATRRR